MNNDELRTVYDNLSTEELNKKISENSLTESAEAIAKEVLASRGTESVEVSSEALDTESSFYLGLGVLASIFGVSFLFSDSVSFQFQFGYALAQIVIVGVFSLPIFLLWKFFGTTGKTKSLQYSFNFYTAIFLIVWVVYNIARVTMHVNFG